DVNRDGIPDLAVASSGGGDGENYFSEGYASILLGRGDGTFGAAVSYDTAPGAMQIVAGDFNGDGVVDLATGNRSSIYVDDCSGTLNGKTWDTVSILTGRGNGTFDGATSFSIGDQANPGDTRFRNHLTSLNTNDIDKDGRTDLIAAYGAILLTRPGQTNRP